MIAGLLINACILPFPAMADNATIEDAIKRRPDLSSFYQALVNTGVNRELRADATYTVFAPTNEAFAKLTAEKYPCFYAASCRSEIADVMRNHIVPGEVHVTDVVRQRGGLYSIDKRFIAVAAPAVVGGRNVTSTNLLAGGILYKIDGLIANERELAAFQYPQYTYLPGEQVTTTTRRTIYDPACRVGHCPAGMQETTTVNKTTTMVPVAVLEPAR
jgi:hypothetical protein